MIDEIQQVEEKFGILDRMPVGACILRQDFIVLFWNKCLEDWTGISKHEIVGRNLGEHFPHLKQPKYASRLQQIFEGGPPTIFSSQLHKHIMPSPLPNGQLRIQHTTVTSVARLNGEGFYAIVAVEDVTDLTNRIHDYKLMRDTALVEIEDRKQAQEALYQKTKELEQRNFELTQLNQMSELLQACLTVDEACKVIAKFVGALFPNLNGGLFLIDPRKQLVEVAADWGDFLSSQRVFGVNKCWALRRGRPHLVANTHSCLLCQHLQKHPSEYCCIPLMAQGEALGVLYLSSPESGRLVEAKYLLGVTITEHISLALANLKLRETLQNQSIRDPLTGLFNRRYMEEFLTREIQRAYRNQQPLGIMMLDVDHFKVFNDTFGHDAGDAVLRELGSFLKKNIRRSDIACRYGGEELTIILPEATLEVVQQRAEQLREGVKHLNVKHRGQFLGSITLSLGVACFPEHGLSGSAVLQAADVALYRAKREGRDRVIAAS